MIFERARQVADTVLYEGYVLYPYRASARKNQVRWQFGIVAPQRWSETGGCEPWWMQTECLLEFAPGAREARVTGKIRFLQLQTRTIEKVLDAAEGRFEPVPSLEVDGRLWLTWDEAVECEVDFTEPVPRDAAAAGERAVPFSIPSAREIEEIRATSGALAARCVRERWALAGQLYIHTAPGVPSGRAPVLASPLQEAAAATIRVRVENLTPWAAPGSPRSAALRFSFIGVHTLVALEGGAFISLLEPPAWARAAAAACANVRTWPVLIGARGARDGILSSPIILYDYPEIAPESPGDLFDATEIDEILTLRTLTLTDEEQREARATDARAAAILDRVATMPPEVLDRLHGALRYVRADAPQPPDPTPAPAWWDPGADASVAPDTDCIDVHGVPVSKGSRVRLRPGARRADAQDMFLAGRTATVEGVFFDVEQRSYLAVTLDADPAADLFQWHGRYLYFAPDEVEPLEARE
ncbi:MAG: hypothetical protein AB7V27_17685 [Candidatus Binatia bacterium]